LKSPVRKLELRLLWTRKDTARIICWEDYAMPGNAVVRYQIITGGVEEITKKLNESVYLKWRPILMTSIATNTLAVLLEYRE
jgi:hypothetical protein